MKRAEDCMHRAAMRVAYSRKSFPETADLALLRVQLRQYRGETDGTPPGEFQRAVQRQNALIGIKHEILRTTRYLICNPSLWPIYEFYSNPESE